MLYLVLQRIEIALEVVDDFEAAAGAPVVLGLRIGARSAVDDEEEGATVCCFEKVDARGAGFGATTLEGRVFWALGAAVFGN